MRIIPTSSLRGGSGHQPADNLEQYVENDPGSRPLSPFRLLRPLPEPRLNPIRWASRPLGADMARPSRTGGKTSAAKARKGNSAKGRKPKFRSHKASGSSKTALRTKTSVID